MNLNPLQITPSLTLTQVLSETHIFLFLATLMQTEGWYPLGKTTCEGNRIDGYTSQFGLKQLIHEPINITGERSPCIDLIFASQPNLVMELGAQSSSHQNCYHQRVLARFMTYDMKQILTILEKESMVYNRKNHFKIWTSKTWFTYLIKLSKIYYIILFHIK